MYMLTKGFDNEIRVADNLMYQIFDFNTMSKTSVMGSYVSKLYREGMLYGVTQYADLLLLDYYSCYSQLLDFGICLGYLSQSGLDLVLITEETKESGMGVYFKIPIFSATLDDVEYKNDKLSLVFKVFNNPMWSKNTVLNIPVIKGYMYTAKSVTKLKNVKGIPLSIGMFKRTVLMLRGDKQAYQEGLFYENRR